MTLYDIHTICIFQNREGEVKGWNVSQKIGWILISSTTNPNIFWGCHVYASSLKVLGGGGEGGGKKGGGGSGDERW